MTSVVRVETKRWKGVALIWMRAGGVVDWEHEALWSEQGGWQWGQVSQRARM
ncbi:hypothetical protein LY78DRAFT_452872 [Colletotrichum sublineola]|nr:hypothetical protein LY78DRAFT_452872 [Colletotrichum sublineola]